MTTFGFGIALLPTQMNRRQRQTHIDCDLTRNFTRPGGTLPPTRYRVLLRLKIGPGPTRQRTDEASRLRRSSSFRRITSLAQRQGIWCQTRHAASNALLSEAHPSCQSARDQGVCCCYDRHIILGRTGRDFLQHRFNRYQTNPQFCGWKSGRRPAFMRSARSTTNDDPSRSRGPCRRNRI